MSDDDLIRRGDAFAVVKGLSLLEGDILALPAVTVGVKPLVWRQYCSNAGNSSAPAFGGEYICERAGEYGHYGVWFPCDGPNSEPRIYHAELPVAKAAAQADYEARILAALAPTDAATQKGGDAHDRRLRSHEASPGVTAGADAAQAREAALREAHKAILAMDTKKDEDLTYNLAVLRAAEKVRRLIDEART